MNLFQLRESEIFQTLVKLQNYEFAVIGGYAINVYALPRFSVDCDIAVKDEHNLSNIKKTLEEEGYKKVAESSDAPYHGKFIRYEKILKNRFKVSIDILIKEIMDRQSGTVFSVDWIFDNSTKVKLKGKTIVESIEVLVPNAEILFMMKFASCRETEIRDLFMIITKIEDINRIRKAIRKMGIPDNSGKIIDMVLSKDFKKNLEGIYGFVPEKIFEKHKELILKLGIHE